MNIHTKNMVISRPNSTSVLKNDSTKRGFSKFNNQRNNLNDDILLQRSTPIILAKPVEIKDENQKPQTQKVLKTIEQVDKPVKITSSHKQPILANLSTNYLATNQLNKQKKEQAFFASKQTEIKEHEHVKPQATNESINQRLSNNIQPMLTSVKLLDETLQFSDSLNHYLTEQSDFLVIGVLGKKGVGKSTLMSLLSGSNFGEQTIFQAGKDQNDLSQHTTNGIHAFVTNERTILLDVQPLINGSVLDKTINAEKKYSNNEFKHHENYVEMQSIELACFVLSVCNVVIILEDWFTDFNLFRLIQTAEMLMPRNTLLQQEEYQFEHHPHLIYTLNKIEYLNKLELDKMKSVIDQILSGSKLIYKSKFVNFDSNGLNLINKSKQDKSSVNFALLPKAIKSKDLSEYDGLSSLNKSVKCFLRNLLSLKQNGNANNNLKFTEKRWFAYANKVWETIRKSQLINEYNRLLT